ncbi:hypothetical protein PP175_27340 (plasmid) [Aneurinibacillus sp. Ricciae_BoGa-3]|uniref:hypothetical protein n=1 Tax=Aneurinibacillus sp. Ricciae_BoGa-3 TaxID=3022697 RepID=UPI00233FA478|nr:hypothetical protein [Aneurinibacillus sp. Ricciae_BoGa-3]WCK56930.1 hypothetical protein PP175_27455 [Aneurinibacillus sp. Ricciae_BoGa-3]WCK57753.1 hypothetical protein PP175_27340 [Aneurinibacillus sp. Ricciae_BoGa-3]
MTRLNRLKNLKKNKKGTMAIEIVIGMFMFLVALSFMTDIAIIGWKFSVISQTNSFVARTAMLQGGITSSAPYGFPGADRAYLTSSEVATKVADNFKKAGIKAGDYQVTINGANLGSDVTVDYGGDIVTQIKVNYKWSLLSNFIPGLLSNSTTSTRTVNSEFKYRYSDFSGE